MWIYLVSNILLGNPLFKFSNQLTLLTSSFSGQKNSYLQLFVTRLKQRNDLFLFLIVASEREKVDLTLADHLPKFLQKG